MGRYREPYTIFKRGKFYYYRTYDVRGDRTTAHTTGCKTKGDAKRYCEALHLSGSLTVSSTSLYNYAEHFYDDDSLYMTDRSTPLAYNTRINYQKILKRAILPNVDGVRLCDVSYTWLKGFRQKLSRDYSSSSVQSAMSLLRHIIETAYRDGHIARNPFEMLESQTVKYGKRDAFSLDEVRSLYDAIGDEYKDTILLMALTGMRISEAIGIRPHDIKRGMAGLYIDLKEQLSHGEYCPVKCGSERCIPIIAEIKELSPCDKTRVSDFYKVYNRIKKTIPHAEERNLSFHSLRHFFITDAKSRGVNPLKVEVIAGHRLKGMEGVYTNFKAEDLSDILAWQAQTLKAIKKPL